MDQQVDKIRFSIIIAAYNIEDYIQRADKSMYKEKEKIHKILDSTKLRKNK